MPDGHLGVLRAIAAGYEAIETNDQAALEAAEDAFFEASNPIVAAMPGTEAAFEDQPTAVFDLQRAQLDLFFAAAEAFEQAIAASKWDDVDRTLWDAIPALSDAATDHLEASVIPGLCS